MMRFATLNPQSNDVEARTAIAILAKSMICGLDEVRLAVGISDQCALVIEPSNLAYKITQTGNITIKTTVCNLVIGAVEALW